MSVKPSGIQAFKDKLSVTDIQLINNALKTLQLYSPMLNDQLGQIPPDSSLLRPGLLAYADGLNWNPLGTNLNGLMMYDGSEWLGLAPYKVGTFTPTLLGTTTPGTQTYDAGGQLGKYMKIGPLVQFVVRLKITAIDAATAGSIRVGGLPYAMEVTPAVKPSICIGNIVGVTFSAGYTQLTALMVESNSKQINLAQCGSGIASASLPVTGLTAPVTLNLSGFYFV